MRTTGRRAAFGLSMKSPPRIRSTGQPRPSQTWTRVHGVAEIGAQGFDRFAVWATVLVGVLVLAVVWVLGTGMRPGYDPFGWLTWGHAALRFDLDTAGAPSWKPLTFLFAVLYAVPGHASQMWLWMVTAAAGAVLGLVFAARIAVRLAREQPLWARVAAGAIAMFAVLGIKDYVPLTLVADSDPLIVALCLGAIDRHLSGRPRIAFVLLLLAAFGRPEAAPFACLYAGWLWRTVPSLRLISAIGIALIPVAWFGVPAITSHNWFSAGDTALGSPHQLQRDVGGGVLARFFGLCGWPMRIAWGLVAVLAVIHQDRTRIALLAMVVLWIAVEIGLAAIGWSAVPRYLIEPAAVMCALTAATAGQILGTALHGMTRSRMGEVGAALALVVALMPSTRERVRITRMQIDHERISAVLVQHLIDVIAADGGATRITQCGRPATVFDFRSSLAWALGVNVQEVGQADGAVAPGRPTVLFTPVGRGWQVQVHGLARADGAACAALGADNATD